MKAENIKVYSWREIQKEICSKMGIDEKYFRDLHKLIGGDYKDLWHIWLNNIDPELSNDTISQVWIDEELRIDDEKWKDDEGKNWLNAFFEAVKQVFDENDIVWVHYSW